MYVALTVAIGQDALGRLSTALIGGPTDPALNAGILAWNAMNVPWTQTWYNFPAFYPATDVLTFTEHLLGLSPLASPIYWISGNAVVTYNITLLATYVLCGMTMFALVWRLTASAAASFLAGLAFAFAPYRAAQITHIQVLAVFWAPLALVGLHAFQETRRKRWLVLFGVSWMMQGAANGYFLVFFSVLVGFWVLWFIVAQKRWRDLAMIATAALVASLPLLPILLHFMDAHERYSLARSVDEIRFYSADVTAILCGVNRLTVWGWLAKGICGGEKDLFPGAALLGLCAIAGWFAWPRGGERSRRRTAATIVALVLTVAAFALFSVAVSVALRGPLVTSLGPLRISASTAGPPFTQGIVLILLAAAVSPRIRMAAGRASLPAFYLLMTGAMWMFSWGPSPTLYGSKALATAPYQWLMLLPGLDGLRVPARFWMMAALCLCVAMGLLVAAALQRRSAMVSWLVVVFGACGLALDGWSPIPAGDAPPLAPKPEVIRGGIALTLPITNAAWDGAAQLDAIEGGWVTVNGYSGYEAPHYGVFRYATLNASDVLIAPFISRGDLHVIVEKNSTRHLELVERQRGVQFVGEANGWRQYRVPRNGDAPTVDPIGQRLPVRSLSVSCSPEKAPLVLDGDSTTRWECGPQQSGQELIADLGGETTVGQVMPALGAFPTDFPRQVRVQTSLDGVTWTDAWDGGVLREMFEAVTRDVHTTKMVLSFTPRPARFVRFRLMSNDDVWYWSIAELEVWTGRS